MKTSFHWRHYKAVYMAVNGQNSLYARHDRAIVQKFSIGMEIAGGGFKRPTMQFWRV